MKNKYRISAICIAAVLAALSMPLGVFAASDDVKPTSVYINNVYGSERTKTLSVGQEFQLEYVIRPNDADTYLDVTYTASNYSVADVDAGGLVTAYSPGESTVTIKTGNRKSDTVTIRVLGRANDGNEYRDGYSSSRTSDTANNTGERDTDPVRSSSTSTSSSGSSVKSTPAVTTDTASGKPLISLAGKIDRDSLVKAVRNTESGKLPTLVNYSTVSADSLRAAGEAGATAIQFDTKAEKSVIGRLTVYPENAAKLQGDLKLGVYCNTSNTNRVDKYFADYYKNDFRVIRIDQSRFYMSVRVAVKVGDLSSKNLKFYGYDSVNNNYYDIKVSDARVSNGYLYFVTSVGGYVIVSDGALTIK